MLKRLFLSRLASYSQHGSDTNLSHPILRIKLNALTHVCLGISHTHKLTNYKRVSSQCILHHDYNIT
jgi:hypothetical protein